jgi:acyl-CoA hydrolase
VQPQDVLIVSSTESHLREAFLLKLMDLCTCASAEQLSGHSSVTLAVDDLVITDTTLSVGETIVCKAQVNCAWGTSMECGCTIVCDNDTDGSQRTLCGAFFTFVSLGEDGKKIRLPKLQALDSDNLRRMALAQERRKLRFRRAAIIARAAANVLRVTTAESSASFTPSASSPTTACLEAPLLTSTEIVLPQHANHHGNTFGGQIMAWMSIAARVVASRHATASASATNATNPTNATNATSSAVTHPTVFVVAQSIDDIFFVAPSNVGDRVCIQTRVTRTFAHTMEVQCAVHAHKVGGEKRLINRAVWVFESKCVNGPQQERTEVPLLQVDHTISTEAAVAFEQALGRRALRIKRNALGSGHNLDPSWEWDEEHHLEQLQHRQDREKKTETETGTGTETENSEGDGYHLELVAKNVSSLLRTYWARGTGSWGLLDAASNNYVKLYMRREGGMIMVKAVSRLQFSATAPATATPTTKKNTLKNSLFGLFRKSNKHIDPAHHVVDDSNTPLGRLFAVLCDNTQRSKWDVMCKECKTMVALGTTNDVTRMVFRGMGGDATETSDSDFSLLRSWRANDDRSRYVIANHSIRTKLVPVVEGVKRGAVSSSGWVMEMVPEEQNVCELTYIVTLAAAGVQALGATALDVMAGRSKVICHNIQGVAKVVGATLL